MKASVSPVQTDQCVECLAALFGKGPCREGGVCRSRRLNQAIKSDIRGWLFGT